MPLLELTPDELLSTTRAVRRRLDLTRPVERDVLEQCVRLAVQAPSSTNTQNWHFLIVTDEAKRAALAPLQHVMLDRSGQIQAAADGAGRRQQLIGRQFEQRHPDLLCGRGRISRGGHSCTHASYPETVTARACLGSAGAGMTIFANWSRFLTSDWIFR